MYKSLKSIGLLLRQYRKSGSTFPSSERPQPTMKCPVFMLARPTRPAVPERAPKSSAIDYAVKPFDCLHK